MSNENLLSRREFTLETVLAILGAATITIAGCGDDDPGAGPSPQPGDKEGSVSANHGHRAIIVAAQLNAALAVTLDLRAQATHNHTVQLSQAEVVSIAANTRVIKTSSTDDGHNHEVTFN
jgi:hypothetical protein